MSFVQASVICAFSSVSTSSLEFSDRLDSGVGYLAAAGDRQTSQLPHALKVGGTGVGHVVKHDFLKHGPRPDHYQDRIGILPH